MREASNETTQNEYNTNPKAEEVDKSKVCSDNTNFSPQINKPFFSFASWPLDKGNYYMLYISSTRG